MISDFRFIKLKNKTMSYSENYNFIRDTFKPIMASRIIDAFEKVNTGMHGYQADGNENDLKKAAYQAGLLAQYLNALIEDPEHYKK